MTFLITPRARAISRLLNFALDQAPLTAADLAELADLDSKPLCDVPSGQHALPARDYRTLP